MGVANGLHANAALAGGRSTDKKMVVNVSAAQFLRSDFVATIERTLRMSGLEPGCLDLEITESSLMGNSEQTVKSLNQLCASEIDMTIDDFGMGCFSFN